MDIIILIAVMFIERTSAQSLSQSPSCYAVGDTLTLNCNTADFSSTIAFSLNGNPQGGCSSSGTCAPNIAQSGTITTITLSSFDSSTHSGSWTCSYGISVSSAVIVAENPCSNGGGSTGLPPWAIGLIVVAVLAVFSGLAVVVCCILNKRCKFGDACRDSNLSFTFPPGGKEKVMPKSVLGKDNETPNKDGKENITPKHKSGVEDGIHNQGGKEKVIPKSNLGKDNGTPNKDGKENITPKHKSGVDDGIPIQGGKEKVIPKSNLGKDNETPNKEVILNNELKNGISSLTTSQPRSGANQPLKPVNEN